jgi:hypothetical protein
MRFVPSARISLCALVLASLGLVPAFVACGSDSSNGGSAEGDGGAGLDGTVGPGADGATGTDSGPHDSGLLRCPRTPGPADGTRRVLISHPFDKDGNKAKGFELLSLSAAGVLTRPGVTFEMGVALESNIAFTPDGAVALVAQDDGTVGVVRFEASGPVVVHAAYKGSFYAGRVVMDPRGDRAYVLDTNTTSNKGGIYLVDIACDGSLTDRGLFLAAGSPSAMTLMPSGTDAVIATNDMTVAFAGDTIFANLGGPKVAALGTSFPEGGAITSDIAVMPDGKYALVTDPGVVVGNRVAMVELPGVTSRGILSLPNPAAVVASPFGNAALVMSSDGTDGIRLLRYSGDAAAPFSVVSEITYVHGKPELPSFTASITRGALMGTVLVAENVAVRGLAFHADGGVTDAFKVTFGTGVENVVGVIGTQP